MPRSPESPADLRLHPDANRVCKRPAMVAVTFTTSPGVCRTREGAVSYREGDAIVTGREGEQWPVARERFSSAYAPLPPTQEGRDGIYVPRRHEVLARKLDSRMTVAVGNEQDFLHGEPGDWLLQYEDGSHGIVSGELFDDTYQRS